MTLTDIEMFGSLAYLRCQSEGKITPEYCLCRKPIRAHYPQQALPADRKFVYLLGRNNCLTQSQFVLGPKDLYTVKVMGRLILVWYM